MSNKYTFLNFIFYLTVLLFSSCFNKTANNKFIELKETKKNFELHQWGIVISDMPRLRESPEENATVINYLKEGTVVKILKIENKISTFDNEKDRWCFVDYNGEKGWLFGSFLEIHNDFGEVLKRSEEVLRKKMSEKIEKDKNTAK